MIPQHKTHFILHHSIQSKKVYSYIIYLTDTSHFFSLIEKRSYFMNLILSYTISFILSISLLPVQAQENREQLAKSLKYQTGKVPLPGKIAELNLPKDLQYLDPKQAAVVLEKIWGNPEGSARDTLGMIFPSSSGPLDENSWAIVITYEESGYIKDDDASKMNYDEILSQMKKDVVEANKERKKHGYEQVELVGWATPPHYDRESHKLFWAKELTFGDSKSNTLNYNFRILGRKGVLVLNAVAGMNSLKEIEKKSSLVLSSVSFTKGNSYADFDPQSDKVAEYGLAALILGGGAVAASKAGILKGIWLAIVAVKKFVIIGLVALGGFLYKIFKK